MADGIPLVRARYEEGPGWTWVESGFSCGIAASFLFLVQASCVLIASCRAAKEKEKEGHDAGMCYTNKLDFYKVLQVPKINIETLSLPACACTTIAVIWFVYSTF